MKVYYDAKPDAILYQPLPDGTANVYLRKNIEQAERSTFNEGKEEKKTIWTADEKQIVTTQTKDEVTANFDSLYLAADILAPTLEERVTALEQVIMEVNNG